MGTTHSTVCTKIWKLKLDMTALNDENMKLYRKSLNNGDDSISSLILRHDFNGKSRVYVDGQCIVTFDLSTEPAINLPIHIGGNQLELHILHNNTSWTTLSKYSYELKYQNHIIHEITIENVASQMVKPNHVEVSVSGFKIIQNEPLFEIKVEHNSEVNIILRKYRDFMLLDQVLSWGIHYHLSLPKFPSYSPSSSHYHKEFHNINTNDPIILDQQRKSLETYLKQLLHKTPLILQNPDFCGFIGLTTPLDDVPFSKICSTGNSQSLSDTKKSMDVKNDSPDLTNLVISSSNSEEPEKLLTLQPPGNHVENEPDTFKRKLFTILSTKQAEDICVGASQNSQDYLNDLAVGDLCTLLKSLLKTENVDPLIRSFERFRRKKQEFDKGEFESWCNSLLPSISIVFRDQINEMFFKKRPKILFPPNLSGEKKIILTDFNLKVLSLSFSECYSCPKWDRLYATYEDGLSFQTLVHAIEGYDGPSLFLISDRVGNRFGAISTAKWREEVGYYSSSSGALFSLYPTFNVYRRKMITSKPKSKNVQYLNSRSKTLPLGIAFGGELHSKTNTSLLSDNSPKPRLWIDSEFEICFATTGVNDLAYEPGPLLNEELFREDFQVSEIEIWGLGGQDSLRSREVWRAQKDKMIQKQRKVDKAQFANNGFDREFLLNNTFSGNKRETNDN